MWIYEKRLQFPVDITCKDLKLAKTIIAQYGGPSGESSACMQYLTQRYAMPTGQTKALLTDVGTEEIGHMEIVGTMVYQLMENATMAELKAAGLDGYYALHGNGIFYSDPNGYNWTADYISSKGDPITDLTVDLAAEQQAKITYEYLLNLAGNNESVAAPLRYLRQREVVHFQRFGEALENVREYYRHDRFF